MKTHESGNRRVWYDPHVRMWTLQTNDECDNQIGEVEYVPTKQQAMEFLRTGENVPPGWKVVKPFGPAARALPPIGARVKYVAEPREHFPGRECTGVVVAHYPTDGITYTDPETGEQYISPDRIAVKVDAPLPDWWAYAGTDRFAPNASELTEITD